MGDVTIYLLLDTTLLSTPTFDDAATAASPSSSSSSSTPASFRFRSLSHVMSADASLAELMTVVSSLIVDLSSSSSSSSSSSAEPSSRDAKHSTMTLEEIHDRLTVLDVSYHPARVLTPLVREFDRPDGPRSKTLHSLGWYPSGKLAVLPASSPSRSKSKSKSKDSVVVDREEGDETLLKRFLEWQGRNAMRHEEFAYNHPDNDVPSGDGGRRRGGDNMVAASSTGVRWTGAGAPSSSSSSVIATAAMTPSQIFDAVERRGDDLEARRPRSSAPSRPNSGKKRTEEERTRRLDAMLLNLDDAKNENNNNNNKKKKKKKKATSEKVRRMLLKSRSEGNEKLRMEDRFHIEAHRLWDVVRVEGEEGSSTTDPDADNGRRRTPYRFFSRQTTAGRAASAVAPDLGNDRASEFLVSSRVLPPSEGSAAADDDRDARNRRYRRLPNAMTLHDAQAAGWLEEFDSVVVRIYSLRGGGGGGGVGEGFGPSESVLDLVGDDDVDETSHSDDGKEGDRDGRVDGGDPPEEADDDGTARDDDIEDDAPRRELQRRIRAAFDPTKNEKRKKRKPPSAKVRSMLMKSKSAGDPRLRPGDRVHLEVVLLREDDGGDGGGGFARDETSDPSRSSASSYRYFSKREDVRHLIATVTSAEGVGESSFDGSDAEAWAETIARQASDGAAADGEPAYRTIPSELTLAEAIGGGWVENFGRILIRIFSAKNGVKDSA